MYYYHEILRKLSPHNMLLIISYILLQVSWMKLKKKFSDWVKYGDEYIHSCMSGSTKKRVRRMKTSTLIESHRSESENT